MKFVYAWPHMHNGTEIGEIRRYLVTEKGKTRKVDIPYYNQDGNGWKKGVPENWERFPLFGLETFVDVQRPVIVCEGQKKQRAWAGLGYQVVAALCGAKSADYADWSPLKGARRIWYAPDNDQPGEDFAQEVWSILRKFEPVDQQVIRLPGLKQKGDLCDWLKLQPELSDWNEYDPLEQHPAHTVIKERLAQTLRDNIRPIPGDWVARDAWQEPLPIDTRLRPVHRLPNTLLPAPLAPWIIDMSVRMGAPIEYFAVSSIIAAAQAIGTSCGIRPKKFDTWTVTINLWGIVTGPVSTKKTAAMLASLKPLQSIDNELYEQHKSAQEEYDKAKFVYEQKLSALKERGKSVAKGNPRNVKDERVEDVAEYLESAPQAPALKRYIVNDATIEAIGQILAVNPRGALLFQDELYALLKGWDREGRQSDRPFFLMAWPGDVPWTIDRATKAQIRPKLCLSILGGMQPDTLKKYLIEANDDLNDGLLPRFQLAIYLDHQDNLPKGGVDQPENAEAKERFNLAFKLLTQTDWLEYGAQQDAEGPPFYRLSNDAQILYLEWEASQKERIAEESNPLMQQHLDKYASLMPSLALVFHLLEVVTNRVGGPVTAQAVQLAVYWCDWLEEHARRIYEMSKPASVEIVETLAIHLKAGKLPAKFTPREVIKKNWRGLREKSTVLEACNQLAELNWLRKVTTQNKRGGPAKTTYEINPDINALSL